MSPARTNRSPANFLRASRRVLLVFGIVSLACARPARAQSLTRAEALKVAETFISHRWESSQKNVRHGSDSDGVEIHTPDCDGGRADPVGACWNVGAANVGVAYKWGGFDTPDSFDAGVRAGKAAGDVYTAEKRRRGGAAVSSAAVGIDCSGFISRCWKLPRKHSTSMLAAICRKLASPSELLPADVMNASEGHVVMFVKWLDDEKKRALFYESAPFSKTLASERDVVELLDAGYQPMRYRKIID
jgi:cell wall-associated NlpC family hydrolase